MLIPTDLLKAALVCASSEESRFYLRGVFLSTTGHLVTTDGHRMFVARLAERPTADVIVPHDAVAAALKMAGARCKEIDVDGTKIASIMYTPIDGTFPAWRLVVPTGLEKPSDKPEDAPGRVHFNLSFVGDFAKMGKLLDGAPMIHPTSASNPALVTFGKREDCFGVLMPMLRSSGAHTHYGAHVRDRVLA
jgi:DNA polymerase-3 subunit beta